MTNVEWTLCEVVMTSIGCISLVNFAIEEVSISVMNYAAISASLE
jgi:hypothetical protein